MSNLTLDEAKILYNWLMKNIVYIDGQNFLYKASEIIPAVLYVKRTGKNVAYVGFSERLTRALVDECNVTQVLRDDEIISAYRTANNLTF